MKKKFKLDAILNISGTSQQVAEIVNSRNKNADGMCTIKTITLAVPNKDPFKEIYTAVLLIYTKIW